MHVVDVLPLVPVVPVVKKSPAHGNGGIVGRSVCIGVVKLAHLVDAIIRGARPAISPHRSPAGRYASPHVSTDEQAPSLDRIRAARARLGDAIVHTPVWRWPMLQRDAPDLTLKLELLQVTGTFKARAALLFAAELPEDRRTRGLTAVSGGNHAIAVAHAARTIGTSAKLVMPKTADPSRIALCRAHGGEVVLVDDVHAAFTEVERIVAAEGRVLVHPFEGPTIATGTGTLGLEILDDVPDVEVVVAPIGGGGLCAGVAAAIKQARPDVAVYGVEPTGADSMHRSFAAGSPQGIDAVRTIADSLGAPHAAPYSYAMCRRYVDELVRVDDDMLRAAMRRLMAEAKLAVEPAGAATTAAVLGPLRDRIAQRRTVAIVCGANIDPDRFARHIAT
jgi:threonine dehydratase